MFLWRLIASAVTPVVYFMANQMISSATFPDQLKLADIVPVHKKGDREQVKNFRPVAFLHNLSKIFEPVDICAQE